MTPAYICETCVVDDAGRLLTRAAMAQLAISAHAFHGVLKLAHTIADLTNVIDVGLVGASLAGASLGLLESFSHCFRRRG
jgi:predicted ATPase with chaperone activity